MVNKPVNLMLEETKEKLSKIINESGLPAFIVELIIRDIYNQVSFLKQKELEKSKKDYEESLKKEEKGGLKCHN